MGRVEIWEQILCEVAQYVNKWTLVEFVSLTVFSCLAVTEALEDSYTNLQL